MALSVIDRSSSPRVPFPFLALTSQPLSECLAPSALADPFGDVPSVTLIQ